jgi:hypothetical protein
MYKNREGKKPLAKTMRRWKNSIKMALKVTAFECEVCIHPAS